MVLALVTICFGLYALHVQGKQRSVKPIPVKIRRDEHRSR